MNFKYTAAFIFTGLSSVIWLTDVAMAQQQIHLKNGLVSLSINTEGGAYTDFHFQKNPLNPLSWKLTKQEMPENNKSGAPFQGQFLCLGRWGSPTLGEIKAGVPHNGEPSRDKWKVQNVDALHLKMSCEAPLDGLAITRTVEMDKKSSVWQVGESVKNTFSVGRVYNIVQHATLGPPFLSSSTIVNSNAGDGFLQEYCYPDPNKLAYRWPFGIIDSTKAPLNLESSKGNVNYVSTHIFDKNIKYGWITAASPDQNLLIGYVWKTAEYPWLNVWHYSKDGVPVAKGLEFGTTGIGKSYKELLESNTFFKGHASYEYIDATESKDKSYICFMIKIPKGFKKVDKIEIADHNIILTINSGSIKKHTLNTAMELKGF